MLVCFFFLFIGFFFFSYGSKHSLLLLLLMEVFVLFCLFFFVVFYFSWVFCLMFLLFSVCVGAYGVSVLVSSSCEKGDVYFLFF